MIKIKIEPFMDKDYCIGLKKTIKICGITIYNKIVMANKGKDGAVEYYFRV
jgi:hypothetical protein